MRNFKDKKQYVIPGDVITTSPLRLRENVTLDGKRIIATSIGLTNIYDDSVRVIPLSAVYLPKIDDIVIGKIKSIFGNSWFADINSCYQGMLLGQDVFGRGSSPTMSDMKSRLDIGDLICAKIANFDRSREPLISIADHNLGKIDSGELVKISPPKIPRLIGKHGSMIQTIESSTDTSITIGQNGLIVLKSESDSNLDKIIKVFKMLDSTTDDSNMDEKIQKILDENN